MKPKVACLIGVLTLTPSIGAVADGTSVKDESFVDSAGHRVLRLSIVINQPVEAVWQAFATDEGFTRWAVPVAHVTLANDGMIESSYDVNARMGDSNNIKNRILAYIPNRLMVLQTVQVPKGAPFDPALIGTIRHIVELEDLGGGRTKVIESGVGYGEGAGYDSMYALFRGGNEAELKSLVKNFKSGPVDWKAEAAKLQSSVGIKEAQ